LRGIFKERTITLKEKIPPLGIHYNYTKFVQQFFYFLKKLTFFCFPFLGERRGFWGKVGGWFTLAGMCKHGNVCIILATDRRKEDSRKQFATIYFVGESTSVGTTTTTNSFTLATYIQHPGYAGMHNFWQWERKPLCNNICDK